MSGKTVNGTRHARDYLSQPALGARRTSRFAVASLVLGFLAAACIVCLIRYRADAFRNGSGLFSASGLCAGILGFFQIVRPHNKRRGLAFAIPGTLLCSIAFALFGLTFVSRESHHPPPCQNNLKQLDIICRMFANEHTGRFYPPLSTEPGRLMFSSASVVPEYLTDGWVMLCGYDEDSRALMREYDHGTSPIDLLIDDHSYFYLGYAVTSDTDVEAFAEAYRERIANGEAFKEDMRVPQGRGNAGTSTIFRLGEGVEQRIYGTEPDDDPEEASPASEIPLFIERLGNHEEPGGNVLYLDGHVDFLEYPGPWPMTVKTIGILNSLDAMSENG